MKLDLTKVNSSPYYWAFLTIVSGKNTNKKFADLMDKKHKANEQNIFDVQLTVDGVEFNFCELIDQMNNQHTEIVKKEAFQLTQDKFQELHASLDKIKRILDDKEQEIKTEMGIDPEYH